VPRRRVRLLPGAAVKRTEATAAGLSRAGGPTVDDAADEVRLNCWWNESLRGRQSVRLFV